MAVESLIRMRILLALLLLFGARCFAASPVFVGTTQDYMTNSGGRITFVWSNRVAIIFDRTNNNAGLGVFPTNTLDVAGHTSLRSNLFLPNRPTNAAPDAFLAIVNGQVVDTAAPSGGSTQLVALAVGALTGTNAGFGRALPDVSGGVPLTVGKTNLPASLTTYQPAIVVTNPFAAPSNTVQVVGIEWRSSVFTTGTGGTNEFPIMGIAYIPAINAGSADAAGTLVFYSRTNVGATVITNMLLSSAGGLTTSAGMTNVVGLNINQNATINSVGRADFAGGASADGIGVQINSSANLQVTGRGNFGSATAGQAQFSVTNSTGNRLAAVIDTIGTNDLLRLRAGNNLVLAASTNGALYYPSNSVTSAAAPDAAKLGVGGCAMWNSNGFGLWMSFSPDGTTVQNKLLGP